MTKSQLRHLISEALPSLTALRREFHADPELSYSENRTSQRVQRELTTLGVAFKPGWARGTGVIAHIPPTDPKNASKPAVALRADMDALPIVERTGKPYASKNPGVMHACGHDGHTTILLGAARVLSKIPTRPNPVTLIFQPAEEGGGGADVMCRQGCLKGEKGGAIGPPVGRIFGLHGWPQLPLGQVATRPGPLLASTDDFVVEVKGVQSHGAYPHLGRDPILGAAHIVTALQSIVSRNVGPLDSMVVTVGEIHGGTANNIIPESVKLVGTIRTLRNEMRMLAKERFLSIVRSTAEALGCTATIDYHEGYPVTSNDADLTEHFMSIARETVGAAHVARVEAPTMGGEDFSYYGHHVPACFYFLGLRPAGAPDYPSLHQPEFDFNDDATPLGVELMCRLALAE